MTGEIMSASLKADTIATTRKSLFFGSTISEQSRTMTARIINKTMDRGDLFSPEAKAVVREIDALIHELRGRDLKISSWYGVLDLDGEPESFERVNRGYGYEALAGVTDDRNFPWFLYWEVVWVVLNTPFRRGERVLDLGGSSSLFSCYLASRGLDVTTVDLNAELVENANAVGRAMDWKLQNHVMDMRSLAFDRPFDHITSICVYEHIPMYDRIEINRTLEDLLVPGGKFSITFDYRNPSRAARIDSSDDVRRQFVEPSGLRLRGNSPFYDSGENYLLHPFFYRRVTGRSVWTWKRHAVRSGQFARWQFPLVKWWNDYTFGALFQEKPV
jgi:2-polyprenyl-3-methyl-5-hydroxy-6-metoxy-1,4-benzoquinol methylase